MGPRLGLGEVLELASCATAVAGAVQLSTRTVHALGREPDAVLLRPSGTKVCVDHGLFRDTEYKVYPLEKRSWWSIFSWTTVTVAVTRVYMLPIVQLQQQYYEEVERCERDANEQDQELEMPPFPWERLNEILHAGMPTAAVEVAKGLALSMCKWCLDGWAISKQSDRWAWAMTKDVRKSLARKGETLTWYERGLRAPATYVRSQANLQFATFIVALPFEVHRIVRQSRREGWRAQRTAGMLGRIVLARVALQEIGLLAGCLGVCIGSMVWPRRATWFSTFLELPALFIMAPKVDAYFGVIIDPPPLGRDGAFHGGAPGESRHMPAQFTQDAYAPQQAQREASEAPVPKGNASHQGSKATSSTAAEAPGGEKAGEATRPTPSGSATSVPASGGKPSDAAAPQGTSETASPALGGDNDDDNDDGHDGGDGDGDDTGEKPAQK